MKTYKEAEDGALLIDNITIPPSSNDYRKILSEKDKGTAEIILFDGDAKAEQEMLEAEKTWVKNEICRADIEIYRIEDGDKRAIGTAADWRAYRRSLRDRIENNVIVGNRPIPPIA